MIEKINVVAKAGCSCPAENPNDPWITDSEPRLVTNNARTRRLLADGSLVRVTEKKAKK